jgi:hypothetical protein
LQSCRENLGKRGNEEITRNRIVISEQARSKRKVLFQELAKGSGKFHAVRCWSHSRTFTQRALSTHITGGLAHSLGLLLPMHLGINVAWSEAN